MDLLELIRLSNIEDMKQRIAENYNGVFSDKHNTWLPTWNAQEF